VDILRLNDIEIFAYHGNKSEEKANGQIFLISIEIKYDLRKAGLSDDLNDTIDFEIIFKIVTETIKHTRFNLLEALGEEICRRILNLFPVTEVIISLRKQDPPIEGQVGSVEVVIQRTSQNRIDTL